MDIKYSQMDEVRIDSDALVEQKRLYLKEQNKLKAIALLNSMSAKLSRSEVHITRKYNAIII